MKSKEMRKIDMFMNFLKGAGNRHPDREIPQRGRYVGLILTIVAALAVMIWILR